MEQLLPDGTLITIIHFVCQVDPERIACMPNMTEFGSTMYHPHVMRTNEPRAVTCPQCRKTEVFKTR